MTIVDDVTTWVDACALDDLDPGRGVCALIGSAQVALFRLPISDDLYAVSNHDPFSDAFVLSRGIVGTTGDAPKVASPVYKQSFDLRTGVCIDDPSVAIATYPVRVVDGRIEIGLR
ncbi:MAG: nitrite reductase small subunit NirD [Acidimicrobiia bacterium]